jgi:hypothetical protein
MPPIPQIDFVAQPRRIEIKAGAQPLATYVYSDPHISRPYFKDLYAPGSVRVSRVHPPRAGSDPLDHGHYHPGLWLAFGDLSGADSWRNKAPVEHISFVQVPTARGAQGTFSVRNRYRQGGEIVCEETCRYTFLIRPSGFLILWESTFASDQGDFWFGDQEEMGLGVRVATPLMVKPRKQDARLPCAGRILDDQGRRNEPGIWGKHALWCDYSGPLADQFAGITIMPDPDNFRPCWWHTRNYGFMAANPFGRAAFKAGPVSKVTVKQGESFRLSYGILLHATETEAALDLPAAYRDFLQALQEGR